MGAGEQRILAHLGRGDVRKAATEAIRGYGPEIVSYLRAVLRDADAADDVFSEFAEHVWKGIAGFRGESSFAAWAYAVAWGAVRRFAADPYRRRRRRLATSEASQLADEVRVSSAAYRATDAQAGVARLRASLSPEEQTLLILRVDRKLSWREVAQALAAGGTPVEEAALRKRFERVKDRLRELAIAEGLLGAG